MDRHEQAACELLRALRGPRSQMALARRLKYQGNPITDWENGRHFPTAAATLHCAEVCGWPVAAAFERFHTQGPPRKQGGQWDVAPWLDRLRGTMAQGELAARCERSRFAVRRWLSGEADIKIADFLRMVDAITGRVHDWVAALVPIDAVPALKAAHDQAIAARRLALDHPWTEALLRLLETDATHDLGEAAIATALGLSTAEVAALLQLLSQTGIIHRQDRGYAVVGTLSVDTRGNPEALSRLQAHWTQVALRRLGEGRTAAFEWHAYNHISVSRTDLAAVQETLKQAFAAVRALVAASEPVEDAALVLLHLIHWETPFHGRAPSGPSRGPLT